MSTCRLLFELSFLFKEAYVNSLISNNMVLKWKIWGYLSGNMFCHKIETYKFFWGFWDQILSNLGTEGGHNGTWIY